MNETEKLLKKVSQRERDELLQTIHSLNSEHSRAMLRPIKLKGGDYYRVRKGNFRIIFHLEGSTVAIDAVRYRSEKTYRDF